MARLRRESPSGNDDSGDSDFAPVKGSAGNLVKARSSPRKRIPKTYHDAEESSHEEGTRSIALVPKARTRKDGRTKQIQLAPLNAASSPRPLHQKIELTKTATKMRNTLKSTLDLPPGTSATKARAPALAPEVETGHGDYATKLEVEESIWCGSDTSSHSSDDELPSIRKLVPLQRPSGSRPPPPSGSFELSLATAKELVKGAKAMTDSLSRPGSSSDKENQAAFLRFSPPRLYSPPKQGSLNRPITPPQSPSKSRLQSPSKTKTRVPTPPIRQSLDAFWDVDTVNDWNDQYSPQKTLKSPKKINFIRAQGSESPTGSPRKNQSPSKATKAEREAKKTFESSKHRLAADFLLELDSRITNGELQKLAESTGGVHFIWSKTLNSTAGRANWRKETTKTTKMNGAVEMTYKHHASIELAEKVINDEDRLLNVIAHEFCHLANFMISGIKDQPHGRQFKEWGRKCTQAFGDRGVEVTTKHSYEIEYRYIWQCSNEECAVEFKRHSKSIDPKRHTCGSCRNKLVQIKPAPRKDAGTGSGYAAFVKLHFAQIRRDMPGASQKEVMEAVGRKYRAEKAAGTAVMEVKTSGATSESAIDLDAVARGMEAITLDDD